MGAFLTSVGRVYYLSPGKDTRASGIDRLWWSTSASMARWREQSGEIYGRSITMCRFYFTVMRFVISIGSCVWMCWRVHVRACVFAIQYNIFRYELRPILRLHDATRHQVSATSTQIQRLVDTNEHFYFFLFIFNGPHFMWG